MIDIRLFSVIVETTGAVWFVIQELCVVYVFWCRPLDIIAIYTTPVEYSGLFIFVSTLHNYIPFLSTYIIFIRNIVSICLFIFLFVFKYIILLHSGISLSHWITTNVNSLIRTKGVIILYEVLVLGYVTTVFTTLFNTIVFSYLFWKLQLYMCVLIECNNGKYWIFMHW